MLTDDRGRKTVTEQSIRSFCLGVYDAYTERVMCDCRGDGDVFVRRCTYPYMHRPPFFFFFCLVDHNPIHLCHKAIKHWPHKSYKPLSLSVPLLAAHRLQTSGGKINIIRVSELRTHESDLSLVSLR